MDYIVLKAGNHTIKLPEPSTILLSAYLDWMDWESENNTLYFINEVQVEDEESFWDSLTSKQQERVLGFAAKELAWWTEQPEKFWRREVNLGDLINLWMYYREELRFENEDGVNCLEIGGIVFYLPERYMSNSTLEDFAESNAYEQNLLETLNGSIRSLFGICTILLRKKGEGFDDYDHGERLKFFEKHLTAKQAFQVGFFLQKQSDSFMRDTEIYTKAETLAVLKQVTKSY